MKIPESPPDLRQLLEDVQRSKKVAKIFESEFGPAPGGKYRHWDTLRHTKPPAGFTIEEYWLVQKTARLQIKRRVPEMTDSEGAPFYYGLPDPILQMLHEVDKKASGRLKTSDRALDEGTAATYVRASLIEEAITSSQLEGAATTRKIAKEMIRSGRIPRNKSERMILNNYRAMNEVRQIRYTEISVDIIEQIHATLTSDTSEHEVSYRQPGDGVGVYDESSNALLYKPPPAEQSRDRLENLCRFANNDDESAFLHPVVKAIIIHFWFASIHPFTDGNGRTARTLFYWYMLHEDFWLIEFISISRILKTSPAKYGRAFLYTETDDNDLTYFILYQLAVVLRAIQDLEGYLERKTRELESVSALIRPGSLFNYRQVSLLSYALRNPNSIFTLESHRNSHGVSYQTSRTDLLGLVKKRLLSKDKVGRKYLFRVRRDLAKKLRDLNTE